MPKPPLHLVLCQPEIPFNAGAIGRTCVALGAKLWLVRPLGFLLDHKHIRRAGLDYWQYLDWEVVDNWDALVDALGNPRFWFFSKAAARHYTDAEFEHGDALVFGSESFGLPREMLEADPEHSLRVPTRPQTRSLNLSVTAGIVAFEARRQLVAAGSMASEPEP